MVNCPLKEKNYNGNCEGCEKRAYCMMSEIIEKLNSLEMKVARVEGSLAK